MPDHTKQSTSCRCIIRNLPLGNTVIGEIIVEGVDAAECFDKVLKTLTRRARRKKSDYSEEKPTLKVRMLSDEITGYISDLKRTKMTLTHIQSNEQTLGVMFAAIGDKQIASVTDTDIRAALDSYKFWPKNARRKKAYKYLSFQEILEIGKKEKHSSINAATYNNHVKRINAFFNMQLDAEHIERSPAKGIAVEVDTSTLVKTRRPLSRDNLARIFELEPYAKWSKDMPHRWWPELRAYAETLAKFNPGIEIPIYTPGQFAKALSDRKCFKK